MDVKEFSVEINKMEFIHLLNFDISGDGGHRIFSHEDVEKSAFTQANAVLDNPERIDKILSEIGWGITSYKMLLDEKNNALAKRLATTWEVKATGAMVKGDKIAVIRALDLSLFFDPSITRSASYLAQMFTEAGARELLNREARFLYYHLYKQFEANCGKPTALSMQRWDRVKAMGRQIDSGNPLYSTEKYNLEQAVSTSGLHEQPSSPGNKAISAAAKPAEPNNVTEEELANLKAKRAYVKSQLNLLRESKNIQRHVGEVWCSDGASKIQVCDCDLFSQRLSEESERKQQLRELAGIAKIKQLPLIQKTVFEQIEQIGVEQPNFHEATELILDTLYAQYLSGMSACLPPLLMHGAPGVGKTRYVRRIANALDLPFCDITLSGNSDAFKVTGLSRYWSNAGPGIIASTFAYGDVANPVFMLDEIDKTHKSENGDPLSRILLLLEKESATSFKDDFIDLPMDVSYASYLATANKLEDLPEPLLNRFVCINIDPLDYNGRCTFIRTVYNELRGQEKYGAFFTESLPMEVQDALAEGDGLTGRELKRVILQAMQRACKKIDVGNKNNERLQLSVGDLRMTSKQAATRKIGFLS